MIQQKTKKIVRRGGATLAAFAVAGGALVATTAPASAASTWDQLAKCESGGNWSINTGNGYYGGLQFSLSTWKAFGGSGMPQNASKAEQIRVATKVQASQGWGAWPACTAKLGISGAAKGASTAEASTSTPAKAKASSSVAKSSASTSAKSKASSSATKSKSSWSAAKSTASTSAKSSATQSVKSTKSAAAATTGKRSVAAVAPVTFNIDVTDSGTNYTVKSGDTLSKIASKLGVNDWRGLFVLNDDQLTNPDVVMVGQTLNVPSN